MADSGHANAPASKHTPPSARKFFGRKHDNPVAHDVKEASSKGQRLTGIDQVFIHGTGVAGFNPFIIGIMTFDKQVEPAQVTEALEKLYDHFPRLGQRVTRANRLFHTGVFVDVENFRPESRLTTIKHAEGQVTDQTGLDKIVGDMMSAPWDMKQPLWRATFIPHYVDNEGAQSAVVFCVHHTFSDAQGFFLDLIPGYKAPEISDPAKPSISKRLRKSWRTACVFARTGRRGFVGLVRNVPHLTPAPARKTRRMVHAENPLSMQARRENIQPSTSTASSPTLASDRRASLEGNSDRPPEVREGWRERRERGTRARNAGKLRIVGHDAGMTRGFSIADFKEAAKGFSVEKDTDAKVGGDGKGKGRETEKGRPEPIKVTLNDVASAIVADCIAAEVAERRAARQLAKRRRAGAAGANVDVEKQSGSRKPNMFRRLEQYIAPDRVALIIPKSLRGAQDLRMHNLSTFMPVYLVPLSASTPTASEIRQHVHRTSRGITIVKDSNFPHDFFQFLRFCGAIPILSPVPFGFIPHSKWNVWGDRVVRPIAEKITPRLSSACFTNVPVPFSEAVELRGIKILKIGGLPPQGGYGSAAIGLVSYGGEIRITAGTDRLRSDDGTDEYVDAARRFCDRFEARFDMYLRAARELQVGKEKRQLDQEKEAKHGSA